MKATLKDLTLEAWLRMREKGVLTWRTKAGKEIAIKDLTDSHLVNIINMLTEEEDFDHIGDGPDVGDGPDDLI